MKIFRGFRVFEKRKTTKTTKNERPKMPEINTQLFNNKNHPLLTVTITRKLLKNHQFGI